MKRIALLLLLITGMAFGQSRNYGSENQDVYFIHFQKITSTETVWTNLDTKLWVPYKAIVLANENITSTNSLDVVFTKTDMVAPLQVVSTNEFNQVVTNTPHSFVVDKVHSVTNNIGNWTNSSNKSAEVYFDEVYLRRGDVLKWSFSTTNMWLYFIAIRG